MNQMPVNHEIEYSIISQITDEEKLSRVRHWLNDFDVSDFYTPNGSECINAIQEIVDAGKQPDFEALCSIVDAETVIEVIQKHYSVDTMNQRIEELKEFSLRRKAIQTMRVKTDGMFKTNDAITEVEKIIEELHNDLTHSRPTKRISTGAKIKKAVYHMCEKKVEEKFVPYGVPFMDKYIQHARKQNHVLVASSGAGKTALALTCIAEQMKLGVKTIYFCRESDAQELVMRLISILSGIDFADLDEHFHEKIACFKHKMDQYSRAVAIIQKYKNNFSIYGKGDYKHDASSIRNIVRIHCDNGGVDMIWIDYLQNMAAPKHIGHSIFEKVSFNADELDLITAEFNVASVVMSQINRGEVKGKLGRRHIKGSSDVENIAHWITILDCKDKSALSDGLRPTMFYSDKVRLRGDFDIMLGFKGSLMKFEKEIVYTEADRPKKLEQPKNY